MPGPGPPSRTEHKTGPLCDLQRHHIIRIHARQSKQQQERQALILDNLEDMARSELDRLLKQHNVASKQLKSTLKKLPVVDQQILAIFERRTTLKKSANNRQKSPSASAIPSLDRPVLPVTGSQVRSLPKEDQRELKSAKEEHSKNETVKLSEQQMLMMELRRGEKEKVRGHGHGWWRWRTTCCMHGADGSNDAGQRSSWQPSCAGVSVVNSTQAIAF